MTFVRQLPDRRPILIATKDMLFRGQDAGRRVVRIVNGKRRTVRRHHYLCETALVLLLTRNLPEIWSILKDRVRSQDAAKVSERIDQAVAADQRTRIDCCIAADLYSITDDCAELA